MSFCRCQYPSTADVKKSRTAVKYVRIVWTCVIMKKNENNKNKRKKGPAVNHALYESRSSFPSVGTSSFLLANAQFVGRIASYQKK